MMDHTADLMVEVWGKDFPELASEAARALFALITDLETIRAENGVSVTQSTRPDRR